MTIRNLAGLFEPTSVTVVGPSALDPTAVHVLLANLAESGFRGPLCGVDLDEMAEEHAITEVASVDDLARPPDLVVLLVAPALAPAMVRRLGAAGARAVLIPARHHDEWPTEIVDEVLKAARPHRVRIVGPGSLGLIAPAAGLNASLSPMKPLPGDLALLARSGAVINATLALAAGRGIGFSTAVSLGQRTDVDLSDLIDWFAIDPKTRAILVHLEHVSDPRKFLSATRAAARTKPVIVIRSGASGDRLAVGETHAARLARSDVVYDAAFARAGCLRVPDVDEMFDAAETVSRLRSVPGGRLAIVANGKSLASFAADRLISGGGSLAAFTPVTTEALAAFVRADLEAENPVVLGGDVSPDRLNGAIAVCLADSGCDGVVAAMAPSAFAEPAAVAAAIAEAAEAHRAGGGGKPVLAAMSGADAAVTARLDKARVLLRPAAGRAAQSFLHLVRHAEAIGRLMETPPSLPADFEPDTAAARAIVAAETAAGRRWLTAKSVQDLLSAYRIEHVPTAAAATPDAAAACAAPILRAGGRIVVKVDAPGIGSKADVGGVRLGLQDAAGVASAAAAVMAEARSVRPDLLQGVLVQPMIERDRAIELYAGIADHAVFGPVIVVGRGGTAVETIADRAIELVPLDRALARSLVARTRVARRLAPQAPPPAPDGEALALLLVKLSQLAVDLPEVVGLDLNPIVADANGALVLDARIAVAPVDRGRGLVGHPRLAIRPYPKEWERQLTTREGLTVLARPLRPEDEPAIKRLMEKVTPEDLRLRFFAPVKAFTHPFLARLAQLDYARAMAFCAVDEASGEILGVVRLHADPDHRTGEYAILVRSDLKGRGLGWALMQLIIDYARADGIATITGEVLRENRTMLAMCEALGFTIHATEDDPAIAEVTLEVGKAGGGS
jgi:acetyltransferase